MFGSDGIELIRELGRRADSPVMLLISNFEDAQRAAMEAGAMAGFGKTELEEPATVERIRAAAEAAAGRVKPVK
jgi:hypothetical protein